MNILMIVSFGDIPATVSAHGFVNAIRGVIPENCFLNLTEQELLEGLKKQNLINVHRVKKKKQ